MHTLQQCRALLVLWNCFSASGESDFAHFVFANRRMAKAPPPENRDVQLAVFPSIHIPSLPSRTPLPHVTSVISASTREHDNADTCHHPHPLRTHAPPRPNQRFSTGGTAHHLRLSTSDRPPSQALRFFLACASSHGSTSRCFRSLYGTKSNSESLMTMGGVVTCSH